MSYLQLQCISLIALDGQPAKRRGPKPDSKPAQTRRQELNRQAQRTHRERKEQYIKALEMELQRLREVYLNDANTAASQLEQREILIQEQRRENEALRQILAMNGIPFEKDLESRKINIGVQMKRDASSSLSPNPMAIKPHGYPAAPAPSSSIGYSPLSYSNGGSLSAGHSPGTTQNSNSPSGPDIQEYSSITPIKTEGGVPDLPLGIFEKDPQLGIDFILQYVLSLFCSDQLTILG